MPDRPSAQSLRGQRRKFHGVFDGGAFVRGEKGMSFQRRIVALAHWCPGCRKPHVLHKGEFEFSGEPDTPTVRPACIHPIMFCDPTDTSKRTQQFHCVYAITAGKIYFGRECTHPLAGQVVTMPDWCVQDAQAPKLRAIL